MPPLPHPLCPGTLLAPAAPPRCFPDTTKLLSTRRPRERHVAWCPVSSPLSSELGGAWH